MKLPGSAASIYTRGYKFGSQRVYVTPLTSGAWNSQAVIALLRNTPTWTKSDHQDVAAKHKKTAQKFERLWGKTQDAAHMERFGRKATMADYRVSGIGRDDYSEAKKNLLRKLARAISDHNILAAHHAAAAKKRGLPA